jgi:hypothetical protein
MPVQWHCTAWMLAEVKFPIECVGAGLPIYKVWFEGLAHAKDARL